MSTGAASACPQCGAPLLFGGAASLVAVCGYCRSAVLRTGADLRAVGEVPDLVATDTRLAVGATGKVQGRSFLVLGRLQLSQGAAVWNEWYATFGDGRWGWLAEAQGRLFVTHPLERISGLPRLETLTPGARLELPGAGWAVVDEIGEARLVSFEGELPVAPEPGETWRFADLSTEAGGFATLDYGAGDEPLLYAGREVSYAEAGLADRAPLAVAGAEPARALTCPGCGGPVSLRRPDTRSFVCPSCRSLLDVTQGDLSVVKVLAGRSSPPVPLGAKGTLRGEPLEVLGYLVRSSESEGQVFSWEELLVHGAGGYRWLSVYGGHWLFLRPVAAGKVEELPSRSARLEGRKYRHYAGATARYDEIQGELYWQVRAGETVETDDYVAPPFLLGVERSAGEVSWSAGEWIPGEEVWKAFALPGSPPRQVGIAPAQPNPITPRLGPVWKVAAQALLGVLVLAGLLALRAPRQEVLALEVPLTPGQVTLSEPFELPGGHEAVEIAASADVDQAWVGLDVALIEEESGESEEVGFELAHFSGVEGGESWSEGSRRGSAVLGTVPGGRYVLRVEPQVERGRGQVPASAQVRVVRGVFLTAPLVLALVLVPLWPVLLGVRAVLFEKRRWAESDHPWGESS